jgi:large-conductance mechanosensitive channel
MFSFLLEEGVLTVGVMSGIFTTGLLNSLKSNIIDPLTENLAPSHTLGGAVKVEKKSGRSEFGDMFPLPTGSHPNPDKTNVLWKIFLRDLIVWIILMAILYIFWKYVLGPLRSQKRTI